MKLLTVNVGSSSVRLSAFSMEHGEQRRVATYHGAQDPSKANAVLSEVLSDWNLDSFDAVVHRIVHGGRTLVKPCLLDAGIEAQMLDLAELAPLHQPAALAWIKACREALGESVPQVAVFDTAFFAELPEVAASYALPRALCAKYGVRRYGFHGLAHQNMWRQWCLLHKRTEGDGRLITLQLGSGCSMAAIKHGQPLDTSMGFSPLEGLVMATRSGDIDPGLLTFLQRNEGLTAVQLEQLLNEQSGLLGLSGTSGDMHRLMMSDDANARLAVAAFCYRARKYLGAYFAVLGGADAIVFGGGIGEHAAAIRRNILTGMEWCGIKLDDQANDATVGHGGRISANDSAVEVWVVQVDEAEILASEAMSILPMAGNQ